MNEYEALIQRRALLTGRISKMDCEIQKIDQRIAFLRRREAGRIDALQAQKKLMNGVSI